MKVLSSLVIGLFLFLGCTNNGEGQQTKKEEIKKMAIEEFNIRKFNQNKDETGNYIFTLEDGTVVTQSGNEEIGYFEYSRKPNALFELRKGFYPNGKLKAKGEMYHNSFAKGEWKSYDSEGKLDRTIDYDAEYDYTWEDIREYCEDRKINLLHNLTKIARYNEDGEFFWTIQYQIPSMHLFIQTMDGKTGEIVKEETVQLDLD